MTDQKSMLETALSEVCNCLMGPCDLKTFISESFLASEEKKGEWWSAIRSILAKEVREMGDSECQKKKLWNKVYALLTEARLASQKNPKIIIPALPTTTPVVVENREPSEILQELVDPVKVPAKKRKRVTNSEKKKKKETTSKKQPPLKRKKVEIISKSIKKSAELLRSFETVPEKRFLYNVMIEQHLRHETINAEYCFSPTESMVYFICMQRAFKQRGSKTNQTNVYTLCEPFFKIFNWEPRSKGTISKKYTALLYYAGRDFGKYTEKHLREYAAKTFLKERLEVINKCITLFQDNNYSNFCNVVFPELQLKYFPVYYHPNVYQHGYKYGKISKNKRKNIARTGVLRIAQNAEKAYAKMRLFAQHCPTQPRIEKLKPEEEEEEAAVTDSMSINTSPMSSSPLPLPVSETIVHERIISNFFIIIIICVHPQKKNI